MVGSYQEKIVTMANDFEPKNEQRDVFGDGNASEKITKVLE